ncbi:GNAT family N-acetyltransferase [Glycomyces sp. NRRL B-16210]|uniref:GNAT family N-acetyltransferase n=1 Tax=Glycomyces sp. NRRL B-16210 TaxID=1463821 RepID=UPI0004C157CA|nr:GNAT family N-acetyltransferase [Glycomyces sp. NRRL B-16210]
MEIKRLDPADRDAVAQVSALFERVREAETPELAPVPERRYADELLYPPPDGEHRCHTVTEAGTLLGQYWIYLPAKENRHYAEIELAVDPAHRRRGVGSALLDHMIDLARREGRTELVVLTRAAWEDGPSRPDTGAKFLERRGFKAALTEVDRNLPIASIDPAEEALMRREAEAAARDYEVVSWVGRCPDRYLESLGRIESLIFSEIPLGEIDLRPRTVDAEFIRTRERRAEVMGDNLIRTIAVRRDTGEVAANTVLFTHEGQSHVQQGITIAAPAHRGHRLGLLVKLANLRLLRERFPHTTHIWTGNADTNANMAAINDRLGFRPVDARVSYRRDLTD